MTRFITFIALLISSFTAVASYDLAIRNVTVIDAKSSVRTNQSVFVTGNQIELIAPASETHVAKRNIDGNGKFLIPGLWDMHVHIVYERALIEAMPNLFLDYGVTSVRDTGALLEKILPEVERWETLGAQAPDLYFAGPLLDGSLVVYDGDGRPEIGVENDSVEAALANFKKLEAAGVDLIKIYELVSPEVFAALSKAASDARLPIAAHVPLSMTASTAGPKVGSMEHLRNVEIACAEDSAELFEKRRNEISEPGEKSGYELRSLLHRTQRTEALKTADTSSPQCQQVIASLHATIQVPTLRLNTITQYSPVRRPDWQEHLMRLPPDLAQNWLEMATFYSTQTSMLGNQMSDWSLKLVNALNKASVPVGAGTDTPIAQAIPGYSLHTELERLVDAGLTTREALAAATIRPAEFFGIENRMGQIQTGMEADLVLLDKDPLENIAHTRTIVSVISDGVIVR